MEDDNGLELSLGLSCGGSNGKSKGKDESGSPEVQIVEAGDLTMFLNTHKQDAAVDGSQRSDVASSGPEASKESFFTNLVKPTETSGELESWDANNKSKEATDQTPWLDVGNKRKMLFEEMNHQKKHDREVQYSDVHGKKSPTVSTSVRTSHISLTTEDASTAENEDVAESEVESSTPGPGLAMHQEDGTKHFMGGNRAYSEASKERFGQKQSSTLPEGDSRFATTTYGMSLPPNTVQYSSKISSVNGEPNTSAFPSPRVVQSIPPPGNVGSGSHAPDPCNLSLTFGYSPVQLPVFNSERSWSLTPHASYTGRNVGTGVPNSGRSEDSSRGNAQAAPQGPSEAAASPDVRKTSEMAKGSGKQLATEEIATSSSTPEEGLKGNTGKEGSNEISAIKQGIAPGMKFGGCGSFPDLPWVSATGSGPNGRTISGVTYRYEKNQTRIVCACHGFHMSAEEFVQHASADQPNQENIPSANGNPAI